MNTIFYKTHHTEKEYPTVNIQTIVSVKLNANDFNTDVRIIGEDRRVVLDILYNDFIKENTIK